MAHFLSDFLGMKPEEVSNFLTMLGDMFRGSGVTLSIFFLTLLFAIPLAFVITKGKMSKRKIISKITGFFLLLIRGTPLMLQLLIVYFGPLFIAKWFGVMIKWPSFVAAIVAYSINYACYFAEIYRGGIESIPKGQFEAAKVLGYSGKSTFFKIVLPQVVKRIIPAMGNEVITLVKDTSLVTIISISELMRVTKDAANANVSFTPFIIAGVFYFVMNWVVAFVFNKIEKKLAYYN